MRIAFASSKSFYNLLSNAVKFTPPGGRISIEAGQLADRVEVTVSDTGIGIPASAHESVFDKFYQVGQRQAGGHGVIPRAPAK